MMQKMGHLDDLTTEIRGTTAAIWNNLATLYIPAIDMLLTA
jgi:hypothetical protein